MDITLTNVLTIIEEHYNNVKTLDALNQELFQQQQQMADKEAVSDCSMTSFFHLHKLKGTHLALKTPAMHLAHLEEKSVKKDKEVESEDLKSINGVTEEYMEHLARAVKDAQVEEKSSYHCSSLEHFICNCLLVRTLRANMQLNCKEGMASKKGAWVPQM